MDEYIERKAFKAEVRRLSTHYLNEWDTLGVLAAVDRIPAADVVSRGAYDKTDWERCVALTQLKEIGKGLGERMDDVRPVVLCRECVNWERYNNTAGCGYCHKVKFEYGADGYVFNPVREPDFYCADGRKADA